ncbi:MAG: PQQ-binding-like beta-propeller repeat protein [Planctomycetaceae bacterium]|nr:PQQ-binding-like beta-propeller repeat protein [Planctomycetaceae bacterium]
MVRHDVRKNGVSLGFQNLSQSLFRLAILAWSIFAGFHYSSLVSAQEVSSVAVTDLRTRKSGEDWSQFLGPRGDGTSSETGIRKEWKTDPPKIIWTQKLGTSYGIGATSNGRYFQFCRYGNSERLTCMNAETGAEIWKWEAPVEYSDMYGYNNGPRTSPVVDNERVYVFGVAGRLACLNVMTGTLIWEKQTNEEYHVVPNFFGVGSTPIVVGDLLWVMIGGSDAEKAQYVLPGQLDDVEGNGTGVVAFDKRTGKEVFRCSKELASYASPVRTPHLRDQGVDLLFFMRGGLLGVNAEKGTEAFFEPWRSSTMESVNAACPVVHRNEVLISETYSIGSQLLKLENGTVTSQWKDGARQREQAFRAHWATPILVDGYLYGCSGRNQPDADLRCIRWSDGKVMWAARTHERMSLLHVDGHFIVLGEDGRLLLMKVNPEKPEVIGELDLYATKDPVDGQPLLSAPCWAAPVLSHGLLYLRGNDRVVCMELIPK